LKTSFNGQKEISMIKFVRLKPKRRSFRSTPPESIKGKEKIEAELSSPQSSLASRPCRGQWTTGHTKKGQQQCDADCNGGIQIGDTNHTPAAKNSSIPEKHFCSFLLQEPRTVMKTPKERRPFYISRIDDRGR
jgi:hypothetical protein